MKYIPHGYQEECINFLHDTPAAGLFLDMGLGKTSIVLKCILDNMYDRLEVRRTIVIAPKRVARVAWPSEIEKWSDFRDIPYTVLHGDNKLENLLSNKRLYIINYDGIQWLEEQYKDKKLKGKLPMFDMLVLDESTFIKNVSTKRWRAIARLFGNVKKKVLLTGTPSPNGLINLYGQIQLIQENLLGKSYKSFTDYYFIKDGYTGGKFVPRRGTSNIIAKRIAPFVKVMYSKDYLKKEEVVYNVIECTMPPRIEAGYEELEKEFFITLDSGVDVEAFNVASLAMKLRQYAQGFVYTDAGPEYVHDVKIEALKELCESVDKPILCAIQFKQDVEMIRKAFGRDIPAMYSLTPDKKGEKHLRDWNLGKIPLLLAHPRSIAHGLNLQSGSNILAFYGLTWSLEDYQQFIARLDRQGQKEGVIAHHFVMKNTIDEAIMKAISYKDSVQSNLMTAIREYRNARLS